MSLCSGPSSQLRHGTGRQEPRPHCQTRRAAAGSAGATPVPCRLLLPRRLLPALPCSPRAGTRAGRAAAATRKLRSLADKEHLAEGFQMFRGEAGPAADARARRGSVPNVHAEGTQGPDTLIPFPDRPRGPREPFLVPVPEHGAPTSSGAPPYLVRVSELELPSVPGPADE